MTTIDCAAGIPDRAALGTKHQARAWSAEHHPYDREAVARERWHAGLPARNHFERDVYRALEAGISAIDRPEAAATARQSPPYREADREAGS
jgi:hypothetical protein